jgi:hypothetical protein
LFEPPRRQERQEKCLNRQGAKNAKKGFFEAFKSERIETVTTIVNSQNGFTTMRERALKAPDHSLRRNDGSFVLL